MTDKDLISEQDLLADAPSEKATFVVQVQFRQNATWQGTISWADKKKSQKFRSALEMIKLIDEALAIQMGQEYGGWNGPTDE